MTTQILLWREQIRPGVAGVDVTAKTATGWAARLSPSWVLVRGVREGAIGRKAFRWAYENMMKRAVTEKLLGSILQAGPEVIFLCYCRNGGFCHTYLLIHWLCLKYPALFRTDIAMTSNMLGDVE